MANFEGNDFDINDWVNDDQFHSPASPSSNLMPTSANSDGRPMEYQASRYSAPSHNYSQHRQQTGLPTGAMLNVAAANSFDNYPTPVSASDPAHYGMFQGYSMDAEAGPSNMPDVYFHHQTNNDSFVDPSAINPQSQAPAWQGMHSHQTEQAGAGASMMQDGGHPQQRLLPSTTQNRSGSPGTQHLRPAPEMDSSEAHKTEQIQRILAQMRHNSVTSSADDDLDNTDSPLARFKKEEEDMDEDERLLASEQGKKLSSKERRQLRNKVSARAFRSRRKEYIGQLEDEVAAKNTENTELKQRMRNLMEQNRQLTQLTQVLLQHPGFNTFMDQISRDRDVLDKLISRCPPESQSDTQQQQQQQHHQQQQQGQSTTDGASYTSGASSSSDSNQANQSHQASMHVGMSMIPETNLDFSTLNLGPHGLPTMTHFNPGNAGYAGPGFQQRQVFALYDLPAGPSVEELAASSSRLSGKQDQVCSIEDLLDDDETGDSAKSLTPSVPSVEHSINSTWTSATSDTRNLDFEAVDPSHELYASSTPHPDIEASSCTSSPCTSSSACVSTKPSFELEPATPRHRPGESDAAQKQLDRLFASTEVACRRIDRITAAFEAR
ncbi:MAG: hypothetical protein M1828_001267 [Chrysothrix sp. TS-e1954]|nr:MAG: hypothetical protein M1828_001267 [Chrysothrix sp. TS-e1954]